MNIGKLDHRITLQRPAFTTNDYGEQIPEGDGWEDVATVPAGKKFDRTDESYAADQKQATQGITWRIRFREDVGPTWRVLEKGVAFYLTGLPVEVERRHALDLKTEYRG